MSPGLLSCREIGEKRGHASRSPCAAPRFKRNVEEAAIREAARQFEDGHTPDDGTRALARAVAAREAAAIPTSAQLKVVST